jgi:hypothetical protein
VTLLSRSAPRADAIIAINPRTQETSVKGIWAEGIWAAGDAVRALEDIYLHLKAQKMLCFFYEKKTIACHTIIRNVSAYLCNQTL